MKRSNVVPVDMDKLKPHVNILRKTFIYSNKMNEQKGTLDKIKTLGKYLNEG